MGIGSNRIFAGVFSAMIAMQPVLSAPAVADTRYPEIRKILHAGHFSGGVDRDVNLHPIGSIHIPGHRYHLFTYAWEETTRSMRGSTPHAQYRLVVLEQTNTGLSYLGSYVTDGDVRPQIKGHVVIFPYKDIAILGDKRSFAVSFEKGPPASIRYGSAEFFR